MIAVLAGAGGWSLALADEGHEHGEAVEAQESAEPAHGSGGAHMIEQMREMHAGHEHGHDFEAMEDVGPERMERVMDAMLDLGLAVPPVDSARGREIFAEKGCVVCHSVNGVGGEIGPSLNAADMPEPMNAFEFAARMWHGAPAMVQMQQDLFGEAIDLSGEELAALIAFAHDEEEQRELSAEQVPERFQEMIVE